MEKIIRYSNRPECNLETVPKSDNISDIIDKLIRLAAKVTEHYASDIIYIVDALKEAVTNKEQDWDRLIWFRETGVNQCPIDYYGDDMIPVVPSAEGSISGIQYWRLRWDASEQKVTLCRVLLINIR